MNEYDKPVKIWFAFGEKKIIIIISVILVVAFLGAASFLAYCKFFKKHDNQIIQQPEKNYFEINDEPSGVYFHISKNFDRMTAQELQLKNPVFIYGFSAKNDKSVYCVVSQTKRDKPGVMKVSDLGNGVLAQIKKSFPDASFESTDIAKVGDGNNGAKIKINYTDNKIPIIQQEIVGITDTTATFAFCIVPKAVVDLYQDDINLFLDSVRIK